MSDHSLKKDKIEKRLKAFANARAFCFVGDGHVEPRYGGSKPPGLQAFSKNGIFLFMDPQILVILTPTFLPAVGGNHLLAGDA